MVRKSLVGVLFMVMVLSMFTSCTAINSVRNDASKLLATSTTSGTSPKTTKAITYSHTGYIARTVTGFGTTITFQDGFSVQFPGNFNQSFLPAIGEKVDIKYGYSASDGGNYVISIDQVP
jgi:hypothetical protein